MIKHTYFPIFVLVMTIILFSCSTETNSTTTGVETINIDVNKFKERGLLSDLIEPKDFIALETNDSCLINTISKVVIFEETIFVLDRNSQKIFRFDIDGNYLGRIGQTGEGPGEYLEIQDLAIDKENRKIYVPDYYKVNVYELNGQFVKSSKLPFMGSHMHVLTNKKFVFYGGGVEDRAIITDEDFTVINSYFPYSQKYRLNNSYIFSDYKNNVIMHLSTCDTIFTLKDGNPKPFFYIDFNGKNFTQLDYEQLPAGDKSNVADYERKSNKFVRCYGFYPLTNSIILSLGHANKSFTGIYNIESRVYLGINQLNLSNDIFGSYIYFNPVGVSGENYIFAVEPSKLLKNRSSDFVKKNVEKLRNTNEHSNPVLFVAKSKI